MRMSYWVAPCMVTEAKKVATASRKTKDKIIYAVALDIISNYYSVHKRLLISRQQTQPLVLYRHMLIWLMRKKGWLLPTEIARLMNKDNKTIYSSINRAEDLIETEERFKQDSKNLINLWRL